LQPGTIRTFPAGSYQLSDDASQGHSAFRPMAGDLFHSPQVFILFLALAAGAIIYVVAELLGGAKRFKAPELVMWGLLLGFLLGYATDLIVTFGGA